MLEGFELRKAKKKDIELIYSLIGEMALYERRPEDRTGSMEQLSYWLFERGIATVQIAEYMGETVGYALYYPVFGSFAAEGRVHLEDLFIRETMRGRGFGTQILARVSADLLAAGYTGMEWSCLDWNKAAAAFYKSHGAKQETGREYFFFDRAGLTGMAGKSFR